MAKTFKRIAALAMAIALVVCFAVSASAAPTVTTTTQYAANQDNVNVIVNIVDANKPDYVTYYAKKGSEVVYVDQADLSSGSATISYQTAATNLQGEVKVGYTNGTATDWAIDGYAVTADKGTVTPSVIPDSGSATVKIAYTASANMKFDTVTAANATVTSATESAGIITVVLSEIEGNVALTVVEKAATVSNVALEYLGGAAITVGDDLGTNSANEAKEGDRKLTVIGKITGTGASEYGVAVSTEEITAANIATVTKYAALGNNNGVFAVQLIDEGVSGEDDILIASNGNYYAAIYALVDGEYIIAAEDTAIAVN